MGQWGTAQDVTLKNRYFSLLSSLCYTTVAATPEATHTEFSCLTCCCLRNRFISDAVSLPHWFTLKWKPSSETDKGKTLFCLIIFWNYSGGTFFLQDILWIEHLFYCVKTDFQSIRIKDLKHGIKLIMCWDRLSALWHPMLNVYIVGYICAFNLSFVI